MGIKIKKAKLIKGETLDVTYVDLDGSLTSKTFTKQPLHEDLKAAFAALGVHLGSLTGYISPKQIYDITDPPSELTKDFTCRGYSVGGDESEDTDGITLSGYHSLSDNKAVILNSPFRRFKENEETGYVFMEDLSKCLEKVAAEVGAHITGRKRGKDPQGELPFEGPATKAQILPEEKGVFKKSGIPVADTEAMERVSEIEPPKKTTKRRVAQTAGTKSGIIED